MNKKEDSQKIENEVIKFLEQLLTEMDVEAKVVHESTDEENGKIKIKIDTENSNLLIGYHGETLDAMQHLLNIYIYRHFGEGYSVLLDVSDYRKKREEKVIEIAESACTKAKFLNKAIVLYPMNSYERKIVHEKVAEIGGVVSESEGEGENRRVVISPAQNT